MGWRIKGGRQTYVKDTALWDEQVWVLFSETRFAKMCLFASLPEPVRRLLPLLYLHISQMWRLKLISLFKPWKFVRGICSLYYGRTVQTIREQRKRQSKWPRADSNPSFYISILEINYLNFKSGTTPPNTLLSGLIYLWLSSSTSCSFLFLCLTLFSKSFTSSHGDLPGLGVAASPHRGLPQTAAQFLIKPFAFIY